MKALLALAILGLSLTASATSKIVSVDAFDLAYSGGLSFSNRDGKGPNRNESQFRLNLNYAQDIETYVGLMWKAQLNFNRQKLDWGSNDYMESSYGVAGGMLYNFDAEDVKNSFLAGIMLGVERATYDAAGRDDESGFNFYAQIEAGKRFDLGKYSVANISYAPTIALNLKRYGGGVRDEYFRTSNELRFNFLKFDILF